ncbi:MAG: hypothetical protein HN742_42415 [Lentisphaerae bacterium]|jgi:hypothetical protein|nr:hypothetical protein [Lentisphaerota bacterium]MBT4819165.1 hypothetical protein [Lentisphaerota bacterium]MBT5605413.1 hypothetical protein [Lentisphaerota bacterium]MBT7062037.1 hypothetical protein [Lentisphaerota bacterium]MBT7848593.1 hypothetical protein [Lentisphaerota bacterium]
MADSTMTSRERVLAAMRREPVDHVPCVCAFNALSPVQRRGHGWNFPWPEGASYADRLAYELDVLGIDSLVPAGASLVSSHPDVTSRAWLEGDVLHKAFTTPAGELHAAVHYNAGWPHGENIPFYSDFNVGHFVEPWIQTEEDLERFTYVHRLDDSADRVAAALDGLRRTRELADRHQLAVNASGGMGLTGAQHLFGATDLCLATMDNPGLVDAYLEHEHRINLRCLEVMGESNCVDSVRRNGFYETTDFYSPAQLTEFLGKRLTAEADCAHANGMLVSYTMNTGVMPALDHLAAIPFDTMFGIDIAFQGVDLGEINAKLGSRMSFFIGPSSTYHIWFGDDLCRQAVRDCFDAFGKEGLIIAPCVSSHAIMPWENTLAMIDEWKKCR